MPNNKETLEEACERVRLGKALTSKMKILLARAALKPLDASFSREIEQGSVRAVAAGVAEEKKKEKMKKMMKMRREEKKEEARNKGIDTNLAVGLSAVDLEGEGKEGGMSRKALYRDVSGAKVLEETMTRGREMQVVVGGLAAADKREEGR
ncbi:hypothetical protein NHQ30_009928 [Ciborinia camelliae]|nr:hypothetical protein NHQ30_009928 [Ciborinia camelliae]